MNRLRVSMAVHETDLEPVAAALAGLADVQFETPEEREPTGWHDLAERLSDQNRRLHGLLKKLDRHGGGNNGTQTPVDIERTAADADALLEEVEHRLNELEAEHKEIGNRIARLRMVSENRRRLETAGIELEKLPTLCCLHLEFGTIPSDQRDRITTPAVRTPVVILPLFEADGRIFIAAASLRKNGFVLNRILASLFYEPIDGLPTDDPRDPDPIETLENARRQNEQNRSRLAEQWSDRLGGMRDRVASALEAARIIDRYGRPGEMVVFTGIISENRIDGLLRAVDNAAHRPHTVLIGKFREAG